MLLFEHRPRSRDPLVPWYRAPCWGDIVGSQLVKETFRPLARGGDVFVSAYSRRPFLSPHQQGTQGRRSSSRWSAYEGGLAAFFVALSSGASGLLCPYCQLVMHTQLVTTPARFDVLRWPINQRRHRLIVSNSHHEEVELRAGLLLPVS